MLRSLVARVSLALVVGVGIVPVAVAQQPLGTFRWQLQPFCNIVTLNVTQQGNVFTLDGFDDQCGAGQRASVVGTAFVNPDGTVGMGLNTVLAPGGAFVHVDARIDFGSLGGPWRDSSGNSGTFIFTPGASTGGPPRPVSPNGIAPGSITSAQLAPGAVGGPQIDPNQVQTRVGGSCPVGQYLRGIHPNGTVICEPLLTPHVSTTVYDPADSVGSESSLAIGADGLPIVSYVVGNPNAGALGVTHCGNPACTAGNVSTTVDDPINFVGEWTSIAIGGDGLPIISHRDRTALALRVTHCGNPACTAGNISTIVDDPTNSVGEWTSIAIGTDGLPIISHRDFTALALRITHCGNAACTAGNISTTVDDTANSLGSRTSIAVGVDGLPIISHWDLTALALRVTHCGNAACTTGNVSTTVDDPLFGQGQTSIAIGADGLPIISHSGGSDLRVTHCGNAACTAGNVSTTVDPANSDGAYTSIAIGADGLPIISHRGSADTLRVTHCGNAACTAGNVSTTVDDPVNSVGSYTSIAITVDGLPIISHFDQTAAALRVTKCATRTCQ